MGNLIWIDLEMTGLDVKTQVIVEIATIVTDDSLNIVAEGPVIAIHHSKETLRTMDEWSRNHHEASGLLDRVRVSPFSCRQAEQQTLEFVSAHCAKRRSPLCGNSVWQDRLFLMKYMPQLEDYFHYRNIDVSSVKELARRWYPALGPYQKRGDHLAAADVKESIEELLFYRNNVFRK